MRAIVVVTLLCLAAGAAVGFARPWNDHRGGGVSAEASLRSGGFAVVVRNDSAEAVRIAQVMVNDAFVGFRSDRLTLASHQKARLLIDYAWVKGEPYEIGVLTSTGAIIQSEVGGAGGS